MVFLRRTAMSQTLGQRSALLASWPRPFRLSGSLGSLCNGLRSASWGIVPSSQKLSCRLLQERDECWLTDATANLRSITVQSDDTSLTFRVAPRCTVQELVKAERQLAGFGQKVELNSKGRYVPAASYLHHGPLGLPYTLAVRPKSQAKPCPTGMIAVIVFGSDDLSGATPCRFLSFSGSSRETLLATGCRVEMHSQAPLSPWTPVCGARPLWTYALSFSSWPMQRALLMRPLRGLFSILCSLFCSLQPV